MVKIKRPRMRSAVAKKVRRVDVRETTIKECANCVPTNWCDVLLTGPDAPRPPLDNRGVEQLLRGVQDRIRSLSRKPQP
jgi:hypothetical protein